MKYSLAMLIKLQDDTINLISKINRMNFYSSLDDFLY